MNPIFVAGPPRSGTTLVQRMLQGGHPGVPECTYLTRQIALYHEWTTYIDAARFPAYFGDKETALAMFREIAGAMLRRVVAEHGIQSPLVLKDPGLSGVLSSLREIFPEAKIVAIVRDPRDVMASLKEVWRRSAGEWDIGVRVRAAYHDYAGIAEFADRGDPRAIFVRYEDIARRDAAIIDEIERFVGYPVSWDAKEPWTIDRRDPFYVPTYGEPVTTTRIGRSREILSEAEIEMVATVFGGARQRWGYV